jgi:hypothetical protein
MKKVLFASGAGGGNGVPVRNGLVAEYKFDECRNLLKYSQQFDNAAWTKTRSTVTANATAAPDGTTTADKFVEDATAANNHAINVTTVTVAGTVTYSIYAKAGERTRFRLNLYESGNSADAYFDLSNGTVDNVTAGGTATITPVGDSWYRCALTSTFNASSTLYLYLVTTGTTVSYNGDGTSGIYLWGAQLEVGSAATTYVPTTDKQTLMDYSKPRKNLLLPNQANCCEDGTTTGFDAVGCTHTAEPTATTPSWQGSYSLKVVTNNAAATEGIRNLSSKTFGLKPDTPYTGSIYLKGAAGGETLTLYVYERNDAGDALAGVATKNVTLTTDWQRVSKSLTFGASGRACVLGIFTTTKQSATFYVDGLQLEEGSTATAWEAPPNIGIVGSAIGTTTNDPTLTGNGQYLTTDDYNILPQSAFSLSQYTLCIVWNPDAADTADVLLSKNSGTATAAGATGFILAQTAAGTGDLTLSQFDSDGGGTLHTVSSATTPAASTWHYSAAACDGTTLYLSLDSAAAYTAGGTTLTAAAANTVKSLYLGRYAHGASGYYAGSIAYIAIYNRVLTQAEIAKNYQYLKSYLKKQRGIVLP